MDRLTQGLVTSRLAVTYESETRIQNIWENSKVNVLEIFSRLTLILILLYSILG